MPGLHPGFVAPDVLAPLDGHGDAMNDDGCTTTPMTDDEIDATLALLEQAKLEWRWQLQNAQHFGPIWRWQRIRRKQERRRALMAQVEARSACTFVPCALCHEGDARETVYWLVDDGRPVCEPCGDAGDFA